MAYRLVALDRINAALWFHCLNIYVDIIVYQCGLARKFIRCFFSAVCRIRFEKNCGNLRPPASFPRLRIHKYGAVRGAPAFVPSLPCFFESRQVGKPNSTHDCIGLRKGLAREDFYMAYFLSEYLSLYKPNFYYLLSPFLMVSVLTR